MSTATSRGKSATHGLPALFEGEDAFIRPRFGAHKEEGFVRQAQALCEGLGNWGGLFVSAFSLAQAVGRYRHDDIGRESFAVPCHYFSKPLRKPTAHWLDLLKLQ